MGGNGIGKTTGLKISSRHSRVSLFRPGQPLSLPAITLDHDTGRKVVSKALMLAAPNPARVWESLNPLDLNVECLSGNGLFVNANPGAATLAFDILRTRLLQATEARGWRRIAITSPTHGCGKSFVAANLAFGLARRASSRAILLDLELRTPALAQMFGVDDAGSLAGFLTGNQPLESQFLRVGHNLALGLNSAPVADAAELLQEETTAQVLQAMLEYLEPDVAIYDLPPALGSDDVIAMLPQIDAVLLVADATRSTAEDVRACERLFEGRVPLMGVVLNRAQDRNQGRYLYGKK